MRWVLVVIPDDLTAPFAPGFPPEMHPWKSTPLNELSELRPTDLPKPFVFCPSDENARRRFVEGFKQGFVMPGVSLYAGCRKLATVRNRGAKGVRGQALPIDWQWIGKSSSTLSIPTSPTSLDSLPQCERVGDIIFRMLTDERIGETDVAAHVLHGNCHLLGIQDLPEEYRRLLEYGYELFDDYLRNCDANNNLDEAAQNLGRAYRESLGVLAPFASPKLALKQLDEQKHNFWLLLKGASQTHTQSKWDKILEWALVKVLGLVEWVLRKRQSRRGKS